MAKVLIVDDSAVARKTLREIVTSLGHVVVGEVNNGFQAFVEYAKLKPDVVTMDLTMQGLGGAQATSKIVATYPEAKVIVISAMEERRVIIDSLERGARHFIIKPINQEKVMKVLQNVLQQDFDLKKHLERVQKMKGADDSLSAAPGTTGTYEHLSPYIISKQAANLVYLTINSTITLTSYQSLATEIEEHLTDKVRVLFDFGAMFSLEQAIVDKLNELVEFIENSNGIVKAISSNKVFVEYITNMPIENKGNLIGDVLRYYEK